MITESAQQRGTYSVTLSKGNIDAKASQMKKENKCSLLRKQARSVREEG